MKDRFLVGAGVALAVTLSGAVGAQAQFLSMPSGGAFYVGGQGGWSTLNNPSGTATGIVGNQGRSTSYNLKNDDGFNVGLRAGYEWGPWRLEEEFTYRKNDFTRAALGGTLNFPQGLSGNVDGSRTSYAFMTNLIYDFTLDWPVTPHVGAGIGAVILRDGYSNPALGTIVSSTSTQFGYQGIAGIRYNISPALAFDVDYRYFATTEPEFRARGFRYDSEQSSHNVLASFTVKFGAPPPPPVVAPPAPPAPPPVQRKVFLVFFDWDRYTITPEGMQILQQAAAAYRSGAPVQIQVTGYTDRSGSPGYNQRLSERRANAVATALAGLGVPRQQMAVSGRGENDNRVPTADGVREPQNRRVEIVFP
jgi:OmpA-OmpF porin, OOP family